MKPVLLLPERFFVLNLWFAWCCGAYLADKNAFDANNLKGPLFRLLYLLIIVAFLIVHFTSYTSAILYDQLDILIWGAPLLFLLSKEDWLKKHHNRVIKIIENIGLSSYSLYLLHEPLIELKNYIVHQFLPNKFQFIFLIIGVIIIPLISWYSFQYIERRYIMRKKITNI